MTRVEAKSLGLKVYDGKPHICGYSQKYVSSMSCIHCTLQKSLKKLYDGSLCEYKTKEKSNKKLKNWRKMNPDKLKMQHQRRIPKQREYYLSNLDKFKDRRLRTTYGITLEQYNGLLENQNGNCAICGRNNLDFKRALAVDHCHKSEKIRGLLCNDCNIGLGMFSDSTNILKSAILYLEKQ
jgi:hypothetical protein